MLLSFVRSLCLPTNSGFVFGVEEYAFLLRDFDQFSPLPPDFTLGVEALTVDVGLSIRREFLRELARNIACASCSVFGFGGLLGLIGMRGFWSFLV